MHRIADSLTDCLFAMPSSRFEQQATCTDKIRQVFEYLKALNEHRSPVATQIRQQPWAMWLDQLPKHPSIEIPLPTRETDEEEHESGMLLRVRRAKITHAPPPPEELSGWVKEDWDDPKRKIELIQSRPIQEKKKVVDRTFGECPKRRAALEKWRAERESWQLAEVPVRDSLEVFNKLYALHGLLERESERFDLVVGDGILSWEQGGVEFFHPLLLQRVQLEFDALQPEFSVFNAESSSELNTSLLQYIHGFDSRRRREEYEESGYHPFDLEVDGILEAIANQISAEGTFIGNRRPPHSSATPVIGRVPVLFLRSRSRGFGTAIQQVLDSLEGRQDFAQSLQNVVGCFRESAQPPNDSERRALQDGAAAHDILFGKPANKEQFEIAASIEHHDSVLVQGPPGTGKSHTIANLIGHFLSRGESVLVTSHSTKALRVLRGHVVPDLQPLCVSVLESDLDSREQLKESIQGISSRLGSADVKALEREAASLNRDRARLVESLAGLQQDMHNACADEYRDVVIGGQGIAPSDAARRVAAGIGQHDWLPGPLSLGEPCPLSDEEVHELYRSNGTTVLADDRFVDCPLPSDLPSADEMAKAFEQASELADKSQLSQQYWPGVRFTTTHIQELNGLIRDSKGVVSEFAKLSGWKLAAVDAGKSHLSSREPWDHLLAKIDETFRIAAQCRNDSVLHRVEAADEPAHRIQLTAVGEIRRHVEGGGGVGWYWLPGRWHWQKSVEAWKAHGRAPESREEFASIERLLTLKIARSELNLLWDGLIAANDGPSSADLGSEPETVANQYIDQLQRALQWWERTFKPFLDRLTALGFDWQRFIGEQLPNHSRFGEMRRIMTALDDHLIGNLETTRNALESARLRKQLIDLKEKLTTFQRPEMTAIQNAIERKDAALYAKAYNACWAADQRRKLAIRRRELIARLASNHVADGWAAAIVERGALHGQPSPPGNAAQAWEWRQLHDELVRSDRVDLVDLGRRIETVRAQLERVTNMLIDRRAWVGQIKRTTPSQRQALMGYLNVIKRIGKGHGIRVPVLRREAQHLMSVCRSAVPVWIMPLARLVENFDFSSTQFDVVIIDEASQCDVMSLLALTLAKKVIVVGDNEQVSPLAIGQNLAIVANLIRTHLEGIPAKELYDGQMSLYDIAIQSFTRSTRLVEHFRCVPDIIQFSNHLSYGGEIKPLREPSSSELLPAVVNYRVEGARREEDKINPEEALAVASLIVAATENTAYANQTMGVITLLGDYQAMEVERLLLKHLSAEEYERRRLICGNSAHFQGDERDVIFLTMVDSPGEGPLRLSARKEIKQRYNVAASRAKNQLWVVHSLNPAIDLQPGDLRRQLIEHAMDPQAKSRELDAVGAKAESPFETQVFQHLVRRGYRVRQQWQVGAYRIDMVIQGEGEKRVAVECDGDRYHPIEKLAEDMARQAILERLGWQFIRLRGTAFFRDPTATIDSLCRRLAEFDIAPIGPAQGPTNPPVRDASTQDVIRRAAELRAEWRAQAAEEPVAATTVGNSSSDELNEDFFS